MKLGMPTLIELDDLSYFFNVAKGNNCSCVRETKTIEALRNSISKLKFE